MRRLFATLLFLLLIATFTQAQIGAPASGFRRLAADPKCSTTGSVYFNTATGKVRVCTVIGSPGTWVDQAANGGSFSFGNNNVANEFTFSPYFYSYAFGGLSAVSVGNISQTTSDITKNYRVGLMNDLTLTPATSSSNYLNFGIYSRVNIPSSVTANLTGNLLFYGGYFSATNSNAGNTAGNMIGVRGEAIGSATNTSSSSFGVYGGEFQSIITKVVPRFTIAGLSISADVQNTAIVNPNGHATTAVYGITGGPTWNAPLTVSIATLAAINVKNQGGGATLNGAGTITDMYGIRINQPSTNFGTQVGTNYGIDIADHSTVGVLNYNIFSRGVNTKNVFQGRIYAQDGTAASPAYNFTSDPDTGFYRVGTNEVGISAGGVKKVSIDSNFFYLFGNVSGQVGMQASATTATYGMTWPDAQASGVKFLQNDGAGNLLWSDEFSFPTLIVHSVPRVASSGFLESSPISAADDDIQIQSANTVQIGDIENHDNLIHVSINDHEIELKANIVRIKEVLDLPRITFADLPASPETGMIAHISDCDSASWGAAISGGGATPCFVAYSGSSWRLFAR